MPINTSQATLLYKLNNNNRISWWKIEQNEAAYTIDYGHDLDTIKNTTQNHYHYPCSSPERAEQEVSSRVAEQIDRKGYSNKIPKAKPDRPMLAQNWDKHIKQQPFTHVAIQPKLDGHRCLSTNRKMVSRTSDVITSCPHIALLLSCLPPEIKLDGELYIPNTDLPTIQSIVRRKSPHMLHQEVQYHIFDIVDESMSFDARHVALQHSMLLIEECHKQHRELWESMPKGLRGMPSVPETCPVRLVPTTFVKGDSHTNFVQQHIKEKFALFISQNYEGCIIRNADAPYQISYRSPDLLKYKEVQDHEFEIIDVRESYDGAVFICKTEAGVTFDCNPAWTKTAKRQALSKKEYYISRWLRVEYEKLSAEGRPLKPIGKLTYESKDHD